MEVLLFSVLVFVAFRTYFIKKYRPDLTGQSFVFQYILNTFFKLSHLIFLVGLRIYSNDYLTALEPSESDYTPLSHNHLLSPAILYFLFIFSGYKIWLNKYSLPPLALVVTTIILILGICFSIGIIGQVSLRKDNDYLSHNFWVFILAPASSILLGILLLVGVFKNSIKFVSQNTYKDDVLASINKLVLKLNNLPLAIFILIIPISTLLILILVLFGQESDSFIKVFTETATWRFSEHKHPPFLEHQGHYLCTVAAQGDPKVVKPIRLGKRYDQIIIVNRQLLIANAFEDLVNSNYPSLHKTIRKFYDKYGYPLSTKIKSTTQANTIYILMKPIEWFFLVCIYFFHKKPEVLINSQYQIN